MAHKKVAEAVAERVLPEVVKWVSKKTSKVKMLM